RPGGWHAFGGCCRMSGRMRSTTTKSLTPWKTTDLPACGSRTSGPSSGCAPSWADFRRVTRGWPLFGALRQRGEPVHRLAQHVRRRRTGALEARGIGQRRPVVGVGHRGEFGVDRAELPAPKVAGRLLSGFRWAPGDFAALHELRDMVLPHRTVRQRRLEDVSHMMHTLA